MDLTLLPDADLLRRTEDLAVRGRGTEADLVAHLGEIDRRRLNPGDAYRSLFEYCVYRLKMSEGAAYRRIRAARTCREHPAALDMLRDGRLSLEGLALLHGAARADDFADLLRRCSGASTRRIEALMADRETEEPQRDVIRFVGGAPPAAAARGAEDTLFSPTMEPSRLAAPPAGPIPATPSEAPPPAPRHRVRLAFTADHRFYVALEKARALLRHKYPDGRLEGVLFDALKALLDRKDPGLRWAARGRKSPSAA